MENRLLLNKRSVYVLPENILIEEYRKNYREPSFKPDVCISTYGGIKVCDKKSTTTQIWIKSSNQEFLSFIKEFELSNYFESTGVKRLNLWRFKKIILEEFYNKK